MDYSANMPFIAGGLVLALIIWLVMKGRAAGAPEKLRITQFMFTRLGTVHRLRAEAVAGVMITEDHGGQREDSDAVVIHRWGRLWARPKLGRDPGTMRSRELTYVTRQNDSSVMNLKALFDPDIPRFQKHTKGQIKPQRDLAARQAMAAAVTKPGRHESLTRNLTILAAVSTVLGASTWVTVTIAATLQG